MEYLVVAVLLYFILRATANIAALLRGEGGTSPTQDSSEQDSSRSARWEGPSPRQHTGTARDDPTFWGEDIEEATWHDIDEASSAAR